MDTIATRLQQLLDRIRQAEISYGRPPGSVTLLAVSKTWPLSDIASAAACGQHAFGENYLQESIGKITQAKQTAALDALEWHYIGAIQSNKTAEIAEHFDWVHSVDRLKIARRLSEQRPPSLPPLNLCLQVNISAEASKSGCLPQEAIALAHEIAALDNIRLRGLMAIPAPADGFDQQRAVFEQLHALYQQIQASGLALDTLSMGMSDDLEAAIAAGATIVRIGSAIFGQRQYPAH